MIPRCARCGYPIQGPHTTTPYGAMHVACAQAPAAQPAQASRTPWVYLGLAVGALALVGCLGVVIALASSRGRPSNSQTRDPSVQEPAAALRSPPPSPIKYTRGRTYGQSSRRWTFILVEGKPSRAELGGLARHLVAADPKGLFTIVDEASKTEQYAAWSEHYPNDAYPFPKAWAEAHIVARVGRDATGSFIEEPAGRWLDRL